MAKRVSNKQKKALQIYATGSSLKQSMLKAGYKESTANNGFQVFNRAKNLQFRTEAEEVVEVKRWFEYIRDKADKRRDYSNVLRANEALAKVNGLFIDKQEIKGDHTITDKERSILDRYT